MKASLLIFGLTLLASSCAKKVVNLTSIDILTMGKHGDPSFANFSPKKVEQTPTCAQYSEGCVSAQLMKAHGLEMIVVEFTNEKDAKIAAQKIRGLYNQNFVFDDVVGEPKLEEFATHHLGGKKP